MTSVIEEMVRVLYDEDTVQLIRTQVKIHLPFFNSLDI